MQLMLDDELCYISVSVGCSRH